MKMFRYEGWYSSMKMEGGEAVIVRDRVAGQFVCDADTETAAESILRRQFPCPDRLEVSFVAACNGPLVSADAIARRGGTKQVPLYS